MSFTTITYNFYCTVSVFILSGYPRSIGVESKTRTYNAHTQRPCTLINLGATCTSYSHAHYQLWYLYIIWRTLFWYWSVYKETTVSHHRSTESASPIDIILLLCVFWVHWRAQWKKHYRRRRFAFVPVYVCIPCLIGLILCRAQFVSIFDFKRKGDSNPHGLWSTPAATSTHHLIIKVANFNYNSICYQDRYLRGSRLYRFVYSFLLSTEGISSRSP